MGEINEKNACLLVDVYCYNCKKLCAMSNTKENDGRRYCEICYDRMFPVKAIAGVKNEPI